MVERTSFVMVLIWVGTEFFVCCGVGKVFLNFADVEGGVHKA